MPTEGISAEVESIEIDDVRQFVARNLQPAGMIVSVAGRIEWDDFVRHVEALLGDWQAAPVSPVATGPRGPATLHVAHDAQQTHVAVGWPAPPYRDDTSHEATAALAVLGGGPSSRFFTEIRERRALCYTVSAGYQTSRDFAHAVCYSGTSADRAQETLDVMLAEIARLPGTITRDEVDRVKARAKSGLIMQQESSAARAGAIARQWYHLATLRTLAEELERYDRLDVDAIEAWLAARQLACGGLNGRPEKQPDVCYSWWVLSSLALLRRRHWVEARALAGFILGAQDGGKGGIADRGEDEADVYHTFFGVAGLALLGYPGLAKVDPVFALPEAALEWLGLAPFG
jgi:hypothetical protein